jgi:hypothetical protein
MLVFFRCPSWTSRLIRWHYKPIAAIRLLCPSWLSENYNRCPCNRKLMRTDIFFTRTTKFICNFANSIVLMFNININYTTARMDYAISAKYKIHNKIYPIQHSACSGKRCIEVSNRDEYKNITTRNVGFFFRCPSWTSRPVHKDGTCQSISIDQRPKITSLWYLERRQHIEMK